MRNLKTNKHPGETSITCRRKHLDFLGLLLVESTAVVAESTALTVTTEASLLSITVETGSLLTRHRGIHSLVSIGDNISRKVEELSEILHTRISQSVVEMAPRTKKNNALIPGIGLLHISTRAQRLKQLNDLKVAHSDILSVLVLAKNVGSMDIINSGEDSI